MLRALVLVGLCGCDVLFQLQTVPTVNDAVVDVRPPADMNPDSTSTGLVAWYPMENAGPGFAGCMKDMAGTHDGNCLGALPSVGPGAIGNGYKFDAMLSVRIADAMDLDTPGFTVAYWQYLVTSPTTTPNGVVCPVNRVSGSLGDDSWQVCPSTFGTFYKVGENGNSTTAAVQLDQWHHVAITFGGGTFNIWLDGISIATGMATVTIDPNDPIVLGMDLSGDGAGNFTPDAAYDGMLDDLRLYNRALDQTEVVALATRM